MPAGYFRICSLVCDVWRGYLVLLEAFGRMPARRTGVGGSARFGRGSGDSCGRGRRGDHPRVAGEEREGASPFILTWAVTMLRGYSLHGFGNAGAAAVVGLEGFDHGLFSGTLPQKSVNWGRGPAASSMAWAMSTAPPPSSASGRSIGPKVPMSAP